MTWSKKGDGQNGEERGSGSSLIHLQSSGLQGEWNIGFAVTGGPHGNWQDDPHDKCS